MIEKPFPDFPLLHDRLNENLVIAPEPPLRAMSFARNRRRRLLVVERRCLESKKPAEGGRL
ncbi:hypothetical protein ACVITL_004012 [Rhizobium pisi]|uniref:hypothetical protein n=1 Tax=Rhizobium TaxID=379 RepID=UPI00103D50EB|nr:hypothetical protein [Rhizobium pisi]TCA42272.1 hypothetical protein E0J16_33235 [Rhizobium pisi]